MGHGGFAYTDRNPTKSVFIRVHRLCRRSLRVLFLKQLLILHHLLLSASCTPGHSSHKLESVSTLRLSCEGCLRRKKSA